MPGPFPGMDPYLEPWWEDVHLSLIGAIREELNDALPAGLICRAQKAVTLSGDEYDGRLVRPDDYVVVGGGGRRSGRATATLERTEMFTVAPETEVHRWLEVRDAFGDEVVTTVEVLSPKNKTAAREAFREKQRDLVAGGVSLVEIDLLRVGLWALYPAEDAVPTEFREPYRLVSTAVGDGVPRSTFSRVRLRDPLPAMPVPLRPDDPSVALELQPLIDRTWNGGRYGAHYRGDPPPFPPDDAAWIEERVREWREKSGGDEPEPAGTPGAG